MESKFKQYLLLIGDIPDFLYKYLEVPSMKRLKNIGYFCGMDYASKDIYNFNEYISRFDHSLSVALLTWRYTRDKNATLAGLFHDISSPCFSHVIDYMNKDYNKQESTEKYTEYIIKNDRELINYLSEDNIEIDALINFKKYSIVDNERPKLCTDRLDGIILTSLFWTKSITLNDIKDILNNIEVYFNENRKKEIGFKNNYIKELVLEKNRLIDEYCHSKEDNYMMELLANITRIAIWKKIICYEQLYLLNENELFKKIENSNDRELLNLINIFNKIKKEDIPDIDLPNVKVRVLKPLVGGKR